MYYKKKRHSKNFDYQQWMNDIELFKKEIELLETQNSISITINKFGNSIYFEKNGYKYRISTHNKIDKGLHYSSSKDLFNDENQINIITNSRKNIIKHLKKILGE